MISLKKSFELQNYLNGLYSAALGILMMQDNTTTTKQEHLRKKVYAEAEDETITKPKRNEFEFSINELIEFSCFIQENMANLTEAINAAKHSTEKNLDGMIAINNQKRRLLNHLTTMTNIKAKECITQGRGVKFNGEGNQVTYLYDIKEVTTIDFDRNKVKAIVNRLRKELDKTSTEIDLMQLNTQVDFDHIFDIGDSLEDAVEKWKDYNKK